MTVRRAWAASVAAVFLLGAAPSPEPVEGDRLLAEFRAICLDWDGALDLAEEAALERGYAPAPELAPEDLFQRGGLYIYARDVDGIHWRVVLKRNRIIAGEEARFLRCSVSATPGNLGSTRRAVGRFTGLRSFAQQNTGVFAWIPGEGDARQPVPRQTFERNLTRLLNEDGMRAILVARHEEQVILTLMTPAEP